MPLSILQVKEALTVYIQCMHYNNSILWLLYMYKKCITNFKLKLGLKIISTYLVLFSPSFCCLNGILDTLIISQQQKKYPYESTFLTPCGPTTLNELTLKKQ